ncbi:MAG: SdpI family protein [Oscillospiraceae bacterium]|nr:SdpI family protein [Oscillospiraceae bacterium]
MLEIIYSFFFGCSLPLLMLFLGIIFEKNPPEEVGGIGYNTSFSRLNNDTWKTAQLIMSRLWKKLGILMLAVSLVLLLILSFIFSGDSLLLAMTGMIMLQVIAMLGSIFLIERELRKIFDDEGERREKTND